MNVKRRRFFKLKAFVSFQSNLEKYLNIGSCYDPSTIATI
jgi:hypothetical protein